MVLGGQHATINLDATCYGTPYLPTETPLQFLYHNKILWVSVPLAQLYTIHWCMPIHDNYIQFNFLLQAVEDVSKGRIDVGEQLTQLKTLKAQDRKQQVRDNLDAYSTNI